MARGGSTRKSGLSLLRLLIRVLERKSRPKIFESRHTIKVCLGFFVPCPLVVCFGRKEHTMYEQSTDRDELRARFTKWMEVTVYRARLNYLKAQSRHIDAIPLEEVEEQLRSPEDEGRWIQEIGLSDSFDFEEEALVTAFSHLPAMKKKVITMLFLLNMTPHEIAEELGCATQYVYKQRSLALKRLRGALKGGDVL